MSNSTKDCTYYDAITAIHMQNNNVKIVLGNQDMEEILKNQGNQNPVLPQANHTIVLPLHTFLYTVVRFVNEPRNQDMVTKMQEIVQNEMSGGVDIESK